MQKERSSNTREVTNMRLLNGAKAVQMFPIVFHTVKRFVLEALGNLSVACR